MNSSEIDYGLRGIFYALTPQETYVEHLKDTPAILPLVQPVIFALSLVEGVVLQLTGEGKHWNLHNVAINLLVGSLLIAWQIFFFRGLDLLVYIWCYNNIRAAFLPWNSLYTYVTAVIGVDFCTYWWHRGSHEISFMWAAHSAHHNGEDYNLSVSNRVSLLIRLTRWLYFVPLGILGIPPSIFIIHSQLNFLFGGWVHSVLCPKMSKIIPGLGHIIEYIMVTPSHHRVHHGSNKYCLDKNYGSLLIIWDRIFGTFAEEKENEPITYGTISQINTFNPLGLQLEPFKQLFEKMNMMKTAGDKVRTLVYGPAWLPGKPRLGDENDIPDVRGRKKTVLLLPSWLNIYLTIQATLIVFTCKEMAVRARLFSQWLSLVNFSLILSSCTALGGLYDAKLYSLWLEPLRLLFFVVASHLYPVFSNPTATGLASGLCIVSLLFWPSLRSYLLPLHSKNTHVHTGLNGKKK